MLRDYQAWTVDASRDILYGKRQRSVIIQLPTGGGKTAILSEIFAAVYKNKRR
ncbi:MAG: DEAD/DEAH box helicase family protein, partial [Treponema sp.]|nr:DEAD/DEAH box helicase family protein [Treponema sp.]